MFNKTRRKYETTDIVVTHKDKGESIEEMLRRMTTNNEGIDVEFPEIFTPANEGVMPAYDIRADKFDIALQANDKYTASERRKGAEGLYDEPDNAA